VSNDEEGPFFLAAEPKTIRIKLLSPTAKAPQYMTAGAAGADVFADMIGGYGMPIRHVPAGRTWKVPLGFSIEIPDGWVGILKGRSGLASRGHEGHVAAIDSDYRGAVSMLVHASVDGSEDLRIDHGDRVGQLLIVPAPQFKLTVVDELSETVRGAGGFGHTGTR
jgi:dUTP pyrophosphatase